MGGSASSLSPSDAPPEEKIIFHCMKNPINTYFMVTPCIDTFDEAIEKEDVMKFVELKDWNMTRAQFEVLRGKNRAFSVWDPEDRIYPIRDMPYPVEIYMCEYVECPTNEVMNGLAGVIVVVQARTPRTNPIRKFGDMIFGTVLRDSTPEKLPNRRFTIITFDEETGREAPISSSMYTVEINVQ